MFSSIALDLCLLSVPGYAVQQHYLLTRSMRQIVLLFAVQGLGKKGDDGKWHRK